MTGPQIIVKLLEKRNLKGTPTSVIHAGEIQLKVTIAGTQYEIQVKKIAADSSAASTDIESVTAEEKLCTLEHSSGSN